MAAASSAPQTRLRTGSGLPPSLATTISGFASNLGDTGDCAGDVDDLLRRQAHVPKVLVVAAVAIGEVGPLRASLADSLHRAEHLRDQLRFRAYPRFAQRVLDDHGAGMLSIDVLDLGPKVRGRQELIDRGVNQHPGRVNAGLVAEDVEADAGLRRLHGDSSHPLEVAGKLAQLLVLEMRDFDSKQVTELQKDLVHRRIPRSLANAVDAGREHLGA